MQVKPTATSKLAALAKGKRKQTAKKVKRQASKIKKVREKAVAALVKLTAEARAEIIKETEDAFWTMWPEGVTALRQALTAMKSSQYEGEISESKVPDHFMRLQAVKQLAAMTMLHEDRDMRQQVIIYNAIGGAFADRLRAAGWTGTQIVPMPEIPK